MKVLIKLLYLLIAIQAIFGHKCIHDELSSSSSLKYVDTLSGQILTRKQANLKNSFDKFHKARILSTAEWRKLRIKIDFTRKLIFIRTNPIFTSQSSFSRKIRYGKENS